MPPGTVFSSDWVIDIRVSGTDILTAAIELGVKFRGRIRIKAGSEVIGGRIGCARPILTDIARKICFLDGVVAV